MLRSVCSPSLTTCSHARRGSYGEGHGLAAIKNCAVFLFLFSVRF